MLYIMRHGRTDWNLKYKLQGGVDIPLNDEGRKMASDAGKQHRDIHFDICFTSPLTRAKETAELFLEGREIPIVVDDRLREMSFGVCEGVENVFEKPDCPVYKLFKDPVNYIPPEGAESFEELYARTGEFLAQIIKPQLDEGKDVLIVGHGALNSCIMCQIKDIPLERYWENGCKNCELIKLI